MMAITRLCQCSSHDVPLVSPLSLLPPPWSPFGYACCVLFCRWVSVCRRCFVPADLTSISVMSVKALCWHHRWDKLWATTLVICHKASRRNYILFSFVRNITICCDIKERKNILKWFTCLPLLFNTIIILFLYMGRGFLRQKPWTGPQSVMVTQLRLGCSPSHLDILPAPNVHLFQRAQFNCTVPFDCRCHL